LRWLLTVRVQWAAIASSRRQKQLMAVNTLSSQDTLSVVIYDDVVDVIVPAGKLNNKEKLIRQIRERLTPRGGTALFAGVSRGIKEASKYLDKAQVNRIILLSDGQANVVRHPPANWRNWAKLPPVKALPLRRWELVRATMKI
jgi:secreted protein with Ig-like and vWFA domain